MAIFIGKGYNQKLLRINLTTNKVTSETIPDEVIRSYLGGDGFLAYYMFNEIPAKCNPLSENNKILIAVGPVTGTLWPSSGRFVMGAKSPLTGFWGESNCGGFFARELKSAGYDLVIIEGMSKKPVYITISDTEVKIIPAQHLWGKNAREVTLELYRQYPDSQVLCIGQAGENLVRYACVMSNLYRAFGRSGMGAVWGSKKLKAIVCKGNKKISVAQPDKFYELAKNAHRKVIEDPRAKQMFRYGTNLLVSAKQAIGELITRNHSDGIFEGADKLASEYLAEHFQGRPRACFGCTNACKEVYTTSQNNPWMPNFTVEGPEYEGTAFFGSNIGVDDYDFILYVSDLCNRYGYDQISVGAVISFIIECVEKGVVKKSQVDNLDLRWGNKEPVIELMHKIAFRKGIGNLLAEGVKIASEKLGKDTEPFALHVKGQEISGQDGRTHRSVGLTHAVGARGADHLRSLVTVDQLGYKEAARKRYWKLFEGKTKKQQEEILNRLCNPYSEDYKAYAVKVTEDIFCIRDSLIVCWYTCGWPPIFWIEDFAEVLPLVTGEDKFGSVDELMLIGERIQNLKRLFNLREGLKPSDDTLPKRFTDEPMPSGPGKGQTANLKRMIKEYYELRDWNLNTGWPSKKKLAELNLLDLSARINS
ncbi:MAG: aldehyde ferredoxin oxidoreductase family protein [Endomicrobia bacterium]|nr:aldehyde ferredoxin oxidoreductase family protein [Endomicrobiia bacterium]